MGNRTRAFLLFLTLWSQFGFDAEAGKIDCPASLNSQNMFFCGTQIDDNNKIGCVSASNTDDAKAQCRKMGGTTWRLNNPVYHLAGVSSGQYICSKAPLKANICQGQGFIWDAKNGVCNFPATINTRESHKVACNDSSTAEVNKPSPAPPCELKDASWVEDHEFAGCQCANGGTVNEPKATCNPPKADTPAEAPIQNAQTQAVIDCTSEFENKIKACKEESELANKNCDQTNQTNKEVDSAKKFVGSIANAFISKAAGSGAKDQCTAASLLSSGTYNILDALKGKCDTNMENCKKKCSEIEGGVIAACLNKSEQPRGNNASSYSQDQVYLYDADKRLSPDLSEAFKLCKDKAAKNQDLLKDALMVMDNAARSGAQCACQLSSNQADCLNVVGPAECVGPNPPAACSNNPLSLGCALGTADYALPKCQCMRDQTLSVCQAPPGKLPFAFAGDAKQIAAGNLGGGIGGGSAGGGNLDLGGIDNPQDARTDDKGAQGSAPGFGTAAASGGSPGGGGPGGGDGAGAAAAGEAGDGAEKNLGLFGMAKSAMSSLFGKGGATAGKDVRNKNANAHPDAEKWRPRGLASTGCKSSQIRCKNETIWDIMNTRYGSNENSFIQKP